MFGDDIKTDIKGANDLGGTSILIYTGKTSFPLHKYSFIKPDYETRNLFGILDKLD